MIDIIKNMYSDSQSAIKLDGLCTDFFNIKRGVIQGDSLSPTLFNIFINDISEIFMTDENTPTSLQTTKIGSLMFADDLLILSETREGLQNSLNKLSNYCDKWQLTVNCKRTITMILNNSCNNPMNISFT